MSVNMTTYENVVVLTPKEDLLGEIPDVLLEKAQSVIDKDRHEFVLDCSEIDAFDSRGLEVLLELQSKCEEGLGTVKLCGLSPTCAKILEITRLARRFESLPDLESAVRSFSY